MSAHTITVGQISITLYEPPALSLIACGVVIRDVGLAAGQRFAAELTKIRAALVAAHAVLVDRGRSGTTTPAEVALAAKLVDLGITSDKETP